MTTEFLLDWPIMAVSLFNTVVLLWLGLTVLLNAEHRTWGHWLAGGGPLAGAAFFISHSAILGHGPDYAGQGLDFWWRVGWPPVVLAPFAWYVMMLWYAGFWDDRQSDLRRRHLPWFALSGVLSVVSIGMLILTNPIPTFWQVTHLSLGATPSVGGVPILVLGYPAYIVLCIVLSLDALRRPGPSLRMMGELARRRSRPWLIAASAVLLLVSLLVGMVMMWIVLNARVGLISGLYTDMVITVAWFDLVIESLIGVAVVLLGQAIVSYEVFTGKTLPRRGLFRHWRSAVILAAGYGGVVGWSIVAQLRPVYSLLLTAILMVAFYALFSYRSYSDRERYIEHLRPFVASHNLYNHLLAPTTPPDVDVTGPFETLCRDFLEAQVAYLIALGPLAPLSGPALTYFAVGQIEQAISSLPVSELVSGFDSPQILCLPIDPTRYAGAKWAVPLWSERGLVGALLLGEKQGRGLYTQEEIEIARASGERLIDTQASAEMARSLMSMQRIRLTESQVVDRRTRRVLHDQILPSLHMIMLALSGGEAGSDEVRRLADVHRQISDLLRDMPAVAAPEVAQRGLVGALRQVVQRELQGSFDSVEWQVTSEAERVVGALPELAAEVLFYAAREAVRNAARHGRGDDRACPLSLRIAVEYEAGLAITIDDDGVGLSVAGSTTTTGGQGLALHSTMMAVIGGTLTIDSVPDQFTRVMLDMPEEALQRF
jgi:signal transduction histidine kinase